ncbi:HD-GYP domain-containing protein [Hippea sp. KM1]|uniref:HD-GYP domain-containing protein n=1 Tax=Hippea sp. KM1 TaxID=944481 RepID=UPI00046D5C8D|nr:HD domain-containing phosphohydrolase [Hippea sp. KM1]
MSNINKLINDLSRDLQNITEEILLFSDTLTKPINLTDSSKTQLLLSLIKPIVKMGVDCLYLTKENGEVIFSFPQKGYYVIPLKELLEKGEMFSDNAIARRIFKNDSLTHFIVKHLNCCEDYYLIAMLNKKEKPYRVKLLHTAISVLDEKIKLARLTGASTMFTKLRLTIEILYKFDKETYMHSYRVRKYAKELARITNLSEDEIRMAEIAGLLHDFGKLFMPPQLLKKTDKLTESEFDTIKLHTVRGYEALKSFGIEDKILDAVLHHHERIDGSGYPDGIKKLSPITSVVAMADILDAVQSARTYKEKNTYNHLKTEIESLKGKLPLRVIDAALKLINSETFWAIKKTSLKKEKSLNYTDYSGDIYERLVQLKSENDGLKKEMETYKRIIKTTQDNYEKLVFKLKDQAKDEKTKNSTLGIAYGILKDSEGLEGIMLIKDGMIREIRGSIAIEKLPNSPTSNPEKGVFCINIKDKTACILLKNNQEKPQKSTELLIKSLFK